MQPTSRSVLVALLALSLVACAAEDPSAIPDAGTSTDAPAAEVDGGSSGPPATIGPEERPARLIVPPAHDGTTALPLVVLLHGYTATSTLQDTYWRASTVARAMGFYLLLPEGTTDSRGNQFWNATPACCDLDGTGVDDVAYLTGLLDAAEAVVPVDTSRVYFIGHSNGSFMSFRMACELADRVTAIGGLAGADFLADDTCVPSQPVSVLHVHGTADATIAYGGNAFYPSAEAAVERWAGRAGCDVGASEMLASIDLDSTLAGDETTVERWSEGCATGVDVELWTIVGGGHIPGFNNTWMPQLATWLLRHRRE
jgi:polyhydroxybutyrate depolymerase